MVQIQAESWCKTLAVVRQRGEGVLVLEICITQLEK